MSARDDELRSVLAHATENAAEVLRRERRASVLSRLVVTGCRHAWLAAVGGALIIVGGGTGAWADAGWIAIFVALVAGWLVLANELSATRVVDERDALSRWDNELGLEDRLLTAHQFLASPKRSGFMQAAIEDARPLAEQVRTTTLRPRAAAAPIWTQTTRNGLAAALSVLLLGMLIRPLVTQRETRDGRAIEVARGSATSTAPPSADSLERPPPGALEVPATPTDAQAPGGKEAAESEAAGEIPESSRDTRGATGEGRSAEASASQGAGQSKGVPSAQGQVSVAAEKKQKASKKKRRAEQPDANPSEPKKKSEEEKSGSTAGSGAASGSNRNPATSDWSSKDQVSETDDDPVEDDSDVDDEDSESESRGGMQPNLRDRRPPVNRDLSVGFGNEPDEEANGRGGPGQQKKSRGTASLVLGVPIPDHIKGQPNPGRTKITQERVEPKQDDAPTTEAGDRTPRAAPAGHIAKPRMSPWLRAIVRAYFLQQPTEQRESP